MTRSSEVISHRSHPRSRRWVTLALLAIGIAALLVPVALPHHPESRSVDRNLGATRMGIAATSSSTLKVLSFTATPAGVFLGQELLLTVSASGGAPPYTYRYTGLPTGCATVDRATLPCIPNASGSFVVGVRVVDSASGNASRDLNLTVGAPPSLELVAVDFDRRNVTVGQSVRIHPEVIGGVGTLTYSYPGLPTGCASQDVATLSCAPQEPGNFTVRAKVADSLGRSANASRLLVVFPGPLSVVSFNATPSSPAAGTLTVLWVNLSGAVGAVTYTYSGLPKGCESRDVPRLMCIPQMAGEYSVTVTARDGIGRMTNASVPLEITNEAPPVIASFSSSPVISPSGGPVRLVVEASGGLGWLTYAYDGLPPGCATANTSQIICADPPDGSYRVGVTVADAFGVSSKSSTLVVVGSGSGVIVHPAANGMSLPGLVMTVGVVGAVVGIVLGALWWRRRRG